MADVAVAVVSVTVFWGSAVAVVDVTVAWWPLPLLLLHLWLFPALPAPTPRVAALKRPSIWPYWAWET